MRLVTLFLVCLAFIPCKSFTARRWHPFSTPFQHHIRVKKVKQNLDNPCEAVFSNNVVATFYSKHSHLIILSSTVPLYQRSERQIRDCNTRARLSPLSLLSSPTKLSTIKEKTMNTRAETKLENPPVSNPQTLPSLIQPYKAPIILNKRI